MESNSCCFAAVAPSDKEFLGYELVKWLCWYRMFGINLLLWGNFPVLIACTLYHRPVKLLLSQSSLSSLCNVTKCRGFLNICVFKITHRSSKNEVINFASSLLPPGILGGFLVFIRAVHLVPGLLHGRALRSAQNPAVHRPGERGPHAHLSWTRG